MTSSLWFTFSLLWSVAGFALLTFMDAAAKSEGDDGIFYRWRNSEEVFFGIVMSLAVFLLWPLWLLLLLLPLDRWLQMKAPLVRAPQRTARRRLVLPRLNAPFWREPEHEAEVISRMVRLRLKKDSRLAGVPPPWRWPMERLLATTEALLLELVRGYLALRADGLAPDDIVTRLEAARPDGPDNPPDARMRPYLKWRLALEDPDYLALGRRVFGPALTQAIRWARRDLGTGETPPTDWLGAEISPEEVESAFEGLFFPAGPRLERWREALTWKRRDWTLMKLRIRDGDVVMQYCEPVAEEEPPGQHGVALVRNGHAVAWIAAAEAAEEEEQDIGWAG